MVPVNESKQQSRPKTKPFVEAMRPTNRPWCCPEPRCQPIHQLVNEDVNEPRPGDSFSCFGRAPKVVFSYDGDEHENDLRSCHYTPLKGLIAYQENVDDWRMLAGAYSTALRLHRELAP